MRSVTLFIALFFLAFRPNAYSKSVPDTGIVARQADSAAVPNDRGWLSIYTSPAGAEVFDGTRRLGVSPLDSVAMSEGMHVVRSFIPSARAWNAVVTIDTVRVERGTMQALRVQFPETPDELRSTFVRTAVSDPALFLATGKRKDGERWMRYTAGGTMIVSGALAAYLKTTSDHYFDTYLGNRDPNVLSKVRTLDRWSAVSLIVSELSFGALIYLLFSD